MLTHHQPTSSSCSSGQLSAISFNPSSVRRQRHKSRDIRRLQQIKSIAQISVNVKTTDIRRLQQITSIEQMKINFISIDQISINMKSRDTCIRCLKKPKIPHSISMNLKFSDIRCLKQSKDKDQISINFKSKDIRHQNQ